MHAAHIIFHTTSIQRPVPGPPADLSAVAYNLQYTSPLVAEFVEQNPHASQDTQVVGLHDHELVRVNFFGHHPEDPEQRLCVIGIGDKEERAEKAANDAWIDYHASLLFTGKLGEDGSFMLPIRYRIPGVSAQRATTVGVAYDVSYMRPLVESAVARNLPTHDECHVLQSGEFMLMRVDLSGRNPLDSSRHVSVAGIADRHYRAMVAAEQAWAEYHTSVLFAANAYA